MPQSQRNLAPESASRVPRHGKHRLDTLDAARVGRRLVMFHPTEADVEALMAKARRAIPGLADTAEVLRVVRHNPDCFLAVARKSRFDPADPRGEGFYRHAAAEQPGAAAAGAGQLSTPAVPDLAPDRAGRANARPGSTCGRFSRPGRWRRAWPCSWSAWRRRIMPGSTSIPVPTPMSGGSFNDALGLTEGARVGSLEAPHLWIFRAASRSRRSMTVMCPAAAADEIGVTVARTFEDLNARHRHPQCRLYRRAGMPL